jgi:hypothetical protein
MTTETTAPQDQPPPAQTDTGGTRGETPKAYVRLRPGAGGSWEAEVRVTADAEAGSAATDEGFTEVPLPASVGQEYPKWVFHEDGRRQVVSNQAEEEKLEGFSDAPPAPKDDDPYAGQLPPAGDAVALPVSTRGPVPVDRG